MFLGTPVILCVDLWHSVDPVGVASVQVSDRSLLRRFIGRHSFQPEPSTELTVPEADWNQGEHRGSLAYPRARASTPKHVCSVSNKSLLT